MEIKRTTPISENTMTGGNHFNVPLFPRTNNKDVVVRPAIIQVANFFRIDFFFIPAV